jgi:hypothetical protein
MVNNIGKKIMHHAENEFAERTLGEALALIGDNPDKNAKYITSAEVLSIGV